MFGNKVNTEADIEFYTVYDSKAKDYKEPFPAKNKDVVLRDFVNAFKKDTAATENRYYMNAEDFSIFKIGSFDYRTGTFTATQPEHIVNLHDLRAIAQPSGIGPT